MLLNEYQKVGIGITCFGLFFLFLGVLMFFDRGLLAIGNILSISGVSIIIGVERALRFFIQRERWRGSAYFVGGVAIVLFGWPVIGMVVEVYGFVKLFSGFFPTVLDFLRRVPVLGNLLMLPGISSLVAYGAGEGQTQ